MSYFPFVFSPITVRVAILYLFRLLYVSYSLTTKIKIILLRQNGRQHQRWWSIKYIYLKLFFVFKFSFFLHYFLSFFFSLYLILRCHYTINTLHPSQTANPLSFLVWNFLFVFNKTTFFIPASYSERFSSNFFLLRVELSLALAFPLVLWTVVVTMVIYYTRGIIKNAI